MQHERVAGESLVNHVFEVFNVLLHWAIIGDLSCYPDVF
jgi:hypothetical protein